MTKSMLYTFDISELERIKQTLSIILIAHVQQPRGYLNPYQLQCSETERFSIEEFNEIYQGIVGSGFYIQSVFFNELDFIAEYMEHPEKFKSCLVYNLARNGVGNNKKTIIPAFCELVGLWYSTSGSLSCALCRNKYYFSKLLNTHCIPTPPSWLLINGDWAGGESPAYGTRIICKPCSESASQGIDYSNVFYYTTEHQLDRYKDTSCLIQEYIDGEECEVPVLAINGIATPFSPVGIDLLGNKILSEKESITNNYNFYALSDTKDPVIIELIEKYTVEAFKMLQMEVYGRIDFRIDANGNPYITDVSTTPYTIRHSSFAFAFEQINVQYNKIYESIISSAILRFNTLKR